MLAMSERSDDYDLLSVGCGLAGSVLARAMVMAGFSVLVVEKETKFKGRVRGEVLLAWGSAEAKELGIYHILLANCTRGDRLRTFLLFQQGRNEACEGTINRRR